jgi:hypothetical protein
MSKEYKTKNYDTEKSRAYYRNNSEYIKQRQKEYDRTHAVERSIYFQEHYIQNRERYIANARKERIVKHPKPISETKPSIVTIQRNIIIIFD